MKTIEAHDYEHNPKVGHEQQRQSATIETPHEHGKHETRDKHAQFNLPKSMSDYDRINMWLRSSVTDVGNNEIESQNGKGHDDTFMAHNNLICCSKAMRDQRKGRDVAPGRTQVTNTEEEIPKQRKSTKQSLLDRRAQEEFKADTDDGESIISSKSAVSSRANTASLKLKHAEKVFTSKVRDLKSGFLDKPRSQVLFKHKWPHMNQNPCYITEALSFNQLNFAQFVGGECRTIIKAIEPIEVLGRLKVLSKIAYLCDQCKNWDRPRSTYYVILSSIEEGEATWSSSFGHFDLMCPMVTEMRAENRVEKPPPSRAKSQPKRDYFCKDFQKGECTLNPPHRAWIRNSFETIDHYCVLCSKAKLGKLNHVPGTETCNTQR